MAETAIFHGWAALDLKDCLKTIAAALYRNPGSRRRRLDTGQ